MLVSRYRHSVIHVDMQGQGRTLLPVLSALSARPLPPSPSIVYSLSFPSFPPSLPSDLSSSLADMLKVIKSVYGDKKLLEKSLKNAAGISQDRDRVREEG